jgi:hypothetical protein
MKTVNADTTWLLQLPRPDYTSHESSTSTRRYFNVLFDPWLSGPQSDVASWFSKQWHVIDPALESIQEVEDFCAATEPQSSSPKTESTNKSYLDAIVISHEFTDHCHKPTLLECHPSIPVIATTKAATLIKGWKHFDHVIETPPFETDWRDCSKTIGAEIDNWPEWVSVARVVTKSDKFYYHSAVMVLFNLSGSNQEAEAVIYTPHGIHPESLGSLTKASPTISTLALLHGLHDVSIDWGQQLNLGAHNGLAAQKALGAKWWIGTHDEDKKGGGVVSWFLRRNKIPLQDAMAKVADDEGGKGKLEDVNFVDAESGQSLVLVR